ncbi:MAG: radical SAM protein [Nitrososphaerota archaeon]
MHLNPTTCKICGTSKIVSRSIGICIDCFRKNKGENILREALETHKKYRKIYGLVPEPPKSHSGIRCTLCSNSCSIGEGEVGYCGLRRNINGRLVSKTDNETAILHYYLDAHVTNCCASWFCPAGTGKWYPNYSCKNGPEYGYYNLAIFFYGCNFDCLFCQNYNHKELKNAETVKASELVNLTLNNSLITCWCFFGGSPEPQLPFAMNSARKIRQAKRPDRILRICFEWNGCGNPHLAMRAAELAYQSGGNIKFDLKCWDEELSIALSGVSNKEAFRNFEAIARRFPIEKDHPPTICATTLLVPGYVDAIEVGAIADFIASIDPEIPYSLLVFHPDFVMYDLPVTPIKQVQECLKTVKNKLKNVWIGNIHLLSTELLL